jgi:hypothetical protein
MRNLLIENDFERPLVCKQKLGILNEYVEPVGAI